MSDYLWDKTGESEEDVERLENLLGQLRFQPRTFEVPTTLPFTSRRTVAPARSTFNWSRLAVAASLLLMLLAGAWLIATKQRTNDVQQATGTKPTSVTTQQPAQQPTLKELAVATSKNDNSMHAPKSVEKQEAFETVASRNLNRRSRREGIAVGLKRPATLPRHLNVRDVNAPREEIAKLTPQEKLAMEQFMLAMKVTSEKLNYAERQVATLNAPQR